MDRLTKASVVEALERSSTWPEAAALLNRPGRNGAKAVQKWAAKHDLGRPRLARKSRARATVEQVREAVARHDSVKAAAVELGYSISGLERRCRKEGISMPPRHRAANPHRSGVMPTRERKTRKHRPTFVGHHTKRALRELDRVDGLGALLTLEGATKERWP